jgi:KEOPS complex subunit Cgi121
MMSFDAASFRNVKIVNVDGLLKNLKNALNEMDFQLFDADRIAGKRHLYIAALNALAAFEGKYMVSKSLCVEAAVYASCQRQISKAFKLVGLTPETRRVAALVFYKDGNPEKFFKVIGKILGGIRDDKILEEWHVRLKELKRLYEVSEAEFSAAQKALGEDEAEVFLRILWERMALLS